MTGGMTSLQTLVLQHNTNPIYVMPPQVNSELIGSAQVGRLGMCTSLRHPGDA